MDIGKRLEGNIKISKGQYRLSPERTLINCTCVYIHLQIQIYTYAFLYFFRFSLTGINFFFNKNKEMLQP